MRALLDAFPSGRVILLLDNFETLIDPESLSLRDSELSDALNALLSGQHHAVKAVITTRIAPRDLAVSEPGRQHYLSLDEGLESPYAENVLREMDADGRVGLKTAPDALLKVAREKTRGYPRALEALYAILSVDRYTTLEELLEISLPEEVVQKLVGEAFNRLDPSAQKVMQALAVYNRPISPAAIDYLLQPHLPSIDSALVLNRLVNMHFARREAGRYYLHPADKEYAFSIIPEKDLTTKDTKVTKEKPKKSTAKVAKEDLELLFKSSRSLRASRLNAFTQHDLLNRAADYFAQARKPRAEWKKLDDLAAQLAEFDLRCAAGDYDTAASVLTDIDFDYLLLWGHHRLAIQLHERILGQVSNKDLQMYSFNGLGTAYAQIGDVDKSILYFEQGSIAANEAQDFHMHIAFLGNLGNVYVFLDETITGIKYYEQAQDVIRNIGDPRSEAQVHENLGHAYLNLVENQKALLHYQQSIQIADKISFLIPQNYARWGLAQAYLFQNDLVNARATIEAALNYDVPENNHNASALHGLIALRQGERETAQEAFTKSIAQADEILAKTPEYYSALDAKGIALSGLVVSGKWEVDSERQKALDEAVETFKKARKIAPHPGVVKSVLRLFDELVKCDGGEILKDVRKAVEGVE